jgi:hypothetical protein
MIGEICQLMYEDYIDNKLPAHQSFVFEKRTPEAFYNLGVDTWEMNNLINVPEYAEEINKMRLALEQHIIQSKDIMLATEYDYRRLPASTTPYEYRLTNDYNINEIWQAASLSGFTGNDVKQQQIQFLSHQNDLVRYWAALGLRSQTELTSSDLEVMSAHLNDSYVPVQIYLAATIYENSKNEEAKTILVYNSLSNDPDLSLMALENIQNMDSFQDFGNLISEVYHKTKGVSGLWPTYSSAGVLMYRLKAENFNFSYGTSTISEQDIADFETYTDVVPVFGATFDIVQNPAKVGINQTENCGQIKRTSTNWWELIDIPCNFTIPANEVAYLHVMVNYPAQPDVVVRLNEMGNEMNLRTIHEYTNLSEWQDLVFVLPGGSSGLEVTNIRYLTDCGFQNSPSGFVLNNISNFGYIDEIVVNSNPAPRTSITSARSMEKKNDYSLYSGHQFINYKSLSGQSKKVVIFDIYGKLLFSANRSEVNFQVPKTGLYIVRIDKDAEIVLVM